MNNSGGSITQKTQIFNDFFLGYNTVEWTGIYTIVTGIGSVFLLLTLALSIYSLLYTRNEARKERETQRYYIQQQRLSDISAQWNSLEFVKVRNHVPEILNTHYVEGNDLCEELKKHGRIDDWAEVSVVAHFMERLSFLCQSRQVNIKNARAEFKDVVGYWAVPLIGVYLAMKGERRVALAIQVLHNHFHPLVPLTMVPDASPIDEIEHPPE